jgi:hypothetical protein
VRLNTEAHAAQPTITSGSTELATITTLQTIVPVEFFKAGGSNDILTNLENEVRAQAAKLDISTKAGRDAIASLAYRVACSKKPLENLRKGLTEDIRKQKEAIDAEGRKADERIEALKIEVRKPLTDWENAEKERVAAHEQELQEIANAGPYTLTNWSVLSVEAMRDRLREIETDPRDWQEFATRAAQTKAYAKAQILQAVEAKEAHEAARIELERLRAEAAERAIKEREEAAAKAAQEAAERRAEEQARIAREAAERERQRVENERIEAEARAKQAEAEKIAAELRAEALRLAEAESYQAQLAKERREAEEAEERAQQALRDAEARRVAEAEAAELAASAAVAKAERERYAAVEAERQRVAARQKEELEEAEKRAKNRAHRLKIDNEALGAIVALDIPMDRAQDLLIAIAKGAVPHVTISY